MSDDSKSPTFEERFGQYVDAYYNGAITHQELTTLITTLLKTLPHCFDAGLGVAPQEIMISFRLAKMDGRKTVSVFTSHTHDHLN